MKALLFTLTILSQVIYAPLSRSAGTASFESTKFKIHLPPYQSVQYDMSNAPCGDGWIECSGFVNVTHRFTTQSGVTLLHSNDSGNPPPLPIRVTVFNGTDDKQRDGYGSLTYNQSTGEYNGKIQFRRSITIDPLTRLLVQIDNSDQLDFIGASSESTGQIKSVLEITGKYLTWTNNEGERTFSQTATTPVASITTLRDIARAETFDAVLANPDEEAEVFRITYQDDSAPALFSVVAKVVSGESDILRLRVNNEYSTLTPSGTTIIRPELTGTKGVMNVYASLSDKSLRGKHRILLSFTTEQK